MLNLYAMKGNKEKHATAINTQRVLISLLRLANNIVVSPGRFRKYKRNVQFTSGTQYNSK